MSNKSKRYTDEFKHQIVGLVNNGKAALDISKEYSISRSTMNKRVSDYNNTSSFKAKDNRSNEAKQFKVHNTNYNEEKIENMVKREFKRDTKLHVVVSDLTYVNVKGKWNYICLIIDLYNREIVGYASGKNKDASLVNRAFTKIESPLNEINIFHTDRGNEFKNNLIDNLLNTFKIERSLSKKGCPYDNAVAEATFKIIKTEFAFNKIFDSLEILELKLLDYVNWYNNERIHGSLGYLTPVRYKDMMSEKKLS